MTIFTPSLDLPAFRFLLASGGCLAAGLGVWVVTALCRRWLPGVAAQRSVWLAAQCTVAAVFLLILLPHSERLRLLPPIEIEGVTTAPAAKPVAAVAPAASGKTAEAADADAGRLTWAVCAAYGWLLLYVFGLVYSAFKLLQTQRALHRLAGTGDKSHAHPLDVIEVDAPISPMLFGLFKPRLLLPLHLRSFDTAQQQLIVTHEMTHLRRRDLQWASAGVALQTLFWFNPFMRLLRAKLSWAQELGCDRDVLRGRPSAQRKAYAAALIAQLKLQHTAINTALAFGNVNAGTVASRIALIREPRSSRSPWTRAAAISALIAVMTGCLALQPTLASHTAASATITPLACTEIIDAASGQRLRHEGQCDERVTPASTFNIAVSLMGFDSGILIDEHTPRLPYKSSYDAWNPDWRTDMDPTDWIKNSTVWYAQQVTTKLGADRFQHYVDSFGYGNRDLSGDVGHHNGLTLSWISSSLKISPSEQAAFMRKIVNRQLPLSPRAYEMTDRIMLHQTLANGWTVYGKTGTANLVLPDGRDDDQHQYGWYVGWATKGARTIAFARMSLDHRGPEYAGLRVKDAFLREVATQLDTISSL